MNFCFLFLRFLLISETAGQRDFMFFMFSKKLFVPNWYDFPIIFQDFFNFGCLSACSTRSLTNLPGDDIESNPAETTSHASPAKA